MFSFARQFVKSIETRPQNAVASSTPNYGFRVIHVDQNSPASDLGVEALFDFIVGINGHSLLPSANTVYGSEMPVSLEASEETPPVAVFMEEISAATGSVVSLQIWTAKGRVQRSLQLPVGKQADESGDFGLGLTLQWTPLSVADHVWHVLNVSPNSPAEEAGLISHADYIVGAENGSLAAGGEGLLARVVTRAVSSYYEEHDDNGDGNGGAAVEKDNDASKEPPSIEFYVYNHDYDTLRPVRIQPTPHWGGSGLLGCAVGYGLLHRLPLVVANRKSSSHHRNVSMAPGDTLFDASHVPLQSQPQPQSQSQSHSEPQPLTSPTASLPDLYSPPGLAAGAPVPSIIAGMPAASRKKHGHAHAHAHPLPAADLSNYFAEEEERSKKEDYVTAKATDSSLVPPPPPPPSSKSLS